MEKIVFFINKLYGGGAERVTVALANEFCQQMNYEVHLLVYSRNKEYEYPVSEKIIIHSYDEEQIATNRIRSLIDRTIYLIKKIKEIDPCCVVSLGSPKEITLLTFAAKFNRKKLILSERNDPKNFPQSKSLRFIRLIEYSISDEVVFQTKGAKEFFSGKIQNKSKVISNPLNNQIPERCTKSRKKVIVNWCRLAPQKNLDLLIDAFSKVVKKHPQYKLEIYGEGPEKEPLEKKIIKMGLSEKVFLKGYCNNIYDKVIDAAIFVSSSDYEGISNSMLEAIAMGIPSICTDCPAGGARETIKNGINGILVPVRDEKKLVEAMERLIEDQDLARKISDEGIKLKDDLNIVSISKQWDYFINNIL